MLNFKLANLFTLMAGLIVPLRAEPSSSIKILPEKVRNAPVIPSPKPAENLPVVESAHVSEQRFSDLLHRLQNNLDSQQWTSAAKNLRDFVLFSEALNPESEGEINDDKRALLESDRKELEFIHMPAVIGLCLGYKLLMPDDVFVGNSLKPHQYLEKLLFGASDALGKIPNRPLPVPLLMERSSLKPT